MEKLPLLTRSEARFEAARCLYCEDAPCIKSCPTSIDIPTFIRKIGTDNTRGAARAILDANLLGDSCARVCPVEVLCESTCVYERWGRPAIPIGRLQRYAVHHGLDDELFEKSPATGHSIGLVGAGPASLACAGKLALAGHSPVIYERDEWPGGLNATGVAPYKFKLADNLAEVAWIESLGVEIETGVEIGVDITTAELLERHQAVFLGVGLGPDSKLGIRGEDLPGVVGAVHWIRRLKTDPKFDIADVHEAIVVGGGNTAIDATRELLGVGVPHVRLIYRRRQADMSGYEHELAPALADQRLQLMESVAVIELMPSGHRLDAVLALTQDGRPGGETLAVVPADLVVVAIGQAKLASFVTQFPGVAADDRGRIVVDPATMATGNPRIFAGGDAVNGGKEVVFAAHDGQLAAQSIDALLRERAHA